MINFTTQKILSLVAGVGLAVAAAPGIAKADTYLPDKSHSDVMFNVTHMMISNVKGKFTEYSGEINYDPDKPEKASAKGVIQVASVDTGIEKRDNHLRSDDFFNAEKFPEIKFETTKVKKTKDGLEITANLTMRDVTKKVTFPAIIRGPIVDPWGKKRIGMSASFDVNRQEFGLKWNKTMDAGGLVVSDNVTIILEIEAIAQ